MRSQPYFQMKKPVMNESPLSNIEGYGKNRFKKGKGLPV